ncbi:MAG: Gfo/Idh/MocA family protein, partial [Rectinemataceae bacterium]
MASGKKLKIGVVGLGFGAEFIPLYQKHPDAECVAVCQRDEAKLKQVADMFKVERRYTRYEDMLRDKDIDAIHV